MTESNNTREVAHVRQLIRQQSGKCYPNLEAALSKLCTGELTELARLLRDLDGDKTSAVRNAKLTPWR